MGTYLRQRWITEAVSGVPRADRRSCEYDAYVPDELSGRAFLLDGEVAADVADAEAAIARLDTRVAALTDTEALARLLLRAESVASSRIEGLNISPRRLLRAEAAQQMGEAPGDVSAEEILGNVEAMRLALTAGAAVESITVDTLVDIHRRLLENTPLRGHAGRLREAQNWVGGSSYNPCSAVYVPPPASEVPRLLDDLCRFCNTDALPAVVQAATAHAQFETIHPFADGNGRTGRALIHLILRRRGLSTRIQPPVSLILASRSAGYIGGLTLFRFAGTPDAEVSRAGVDSWIGFFAGACTRAVADATAFEQRCQELEAAWRDRLVRVRAGSSADLLLKALPGTPIVSVKSAMALLGRSKPQVNDAIARLESAGILTQATVGRRNRAFEAREVIDAFTDLERQLSNPEAR
jgi:Fic family protein